MYTDATNIVVGDAALRHTRRFWSCSRIPKKRPNPGLILKIFGDSNCQRVTSCYRIYLNRQRTAVPLYRYSTKWDNNTKASAVQPVRQHYSCTTSTIVKALSVLAKRHRFPRLRSYYFLFLFEPPARRLNFHKLNRNRQGLPVTRRQCLYSYALGVLFTLQCKPVW